MHPKGLTLIILNKITLRIWILLGIVWISLFAPFIIITLIFLYIYRRLVEIVLKIQIKEKFAGLMGGTDNIWAIEDNVSLSLVNILAIVEKERQCSNTIFLEEVRNLINDRIVSKAAGTTLEKLLYRRKQKFGYYFWERSDKINLKNHIKWLECKNDDCNGFCENVSSETFKRNLGSVCNKPLPDNNTTLWEILVGRRCPRSTSHSEESCLSSEECFNTGIHRIPVVIRFHHSLCDGVAIVKVFLKTIADENEVKVSKIMKIENTTSTDEEGTNSKEFVTALCNSGNNIQDETEVVLSYKKNILTVPIYFIYMTQSQIWKYLQDHFHVRLKFFKNVMIASTKELHKKIKEGARLLRILFIAPGFLIHQIIRTMDKNALHNPPQTGEKVVTYWLENDANVSPKLLTKIREIKQNTYARFGDIVLAAISASMHKYYLHINEPAPDALTAAESIRMSENITTLNNEFSFVFQRICISNANGQTITEPNRDSQFFKRLKDITKAHNNLKENQDAIINFWLIKYIAVLLPVKIVKYFFLSTCTMSFSNMMGPQKIRILNNSLSNIAFWTPTRSETALGLCLFSYGGNIQLSLIADKSIVRDEKLLTNILKDIAHEIDAAYNSIKQSQKHPRKKISVCSKKRV